MKKETIGFNVLWILTIVLIVLKLTNRITLSWWLVLGALWIPLAWIGVLMLMVTLLMILRALLTYLIKHIGDDQ